MGLEQLFGWPVLFFGLFIYFVTKALRRMLVITWPKLDKNEYWEDIILPAIPVVIGALLALVIPGKPGQEWLPHIVYTSYFARIGFGSVTGACSGLIYRIFRAMVKKMWGVDLDGASSRPATGIGGDVIIPKPPSMPTIPPPPDTPRAVFTNVGEKKDKP